MGNEIKEIYLSNLEWTKTHDNIGGVMGNVVFKDNMPYETYQKLLKSGYFVLCDKDYMINLQESEAYCYGQYKDYKSRNEKAVEYIKNNTYKYRHDIDFVSIELTKSSTKFINDLENILQGEDKQ